MALCWRSWKRCHAVFGPLGIWSRYIAYWWTAQRGLTDTRQQLSAEYKPHMPCLEPRSSAHWLTDAPTSSHMNDVLVFRLSADCLKSDVRISKTAVHCLVDRAAPGGTLQRRSCTLWTERRGRPLSFSPLPSPNSFFTLYSLFRCLLVSFLFFILFGANKRVSVYVGEWILFVAHGCCASLIGFNSSCEKT